MRTWGRIGKQWVEVSTGTNGDNSEVYLTTLAQVLKLNLGESPFYGDWGIAAETSVLSQVQPDYYVTLTQQRFAPFFASLLVAKQPQAQNQPNPVYTINATTLQGATISAPIPT